MIDLKKQIVEALQKDIVKVKNYNGLIVKRVACNKCIKAYRLNPEFLGSNKDICYWCCCKIFDWDKINRELELSRFKLNLCLNRKW